jgi:hypothetical protein
VAHHDGDQLGQLGDTIGKEEAVVKFPCVTPPRFAQIAMSIETRLDLSELTIEDIAGGSRRSRIASWRRRHARPPPANCCSQRSGRCACESGSRERGSSAPAKGGGGGKCCWKPKKKGGKPAPKDVCHNYGKIGH